MARFETKSNKIYDLIIRCDSILGIDLDKEDEEETENTVDTELDREIKEQFALRLEAKKAKNYAEADRIRNELAARGIILTDTKEGTTYSIK
jgi:cysteinyl-tRNA synthetase